MVVANFLQTTWANKLKIYWPVAPAKLHILTRNDVTSHFRSATNRINMLILGHVQVEISRLWLNWFRKGLQFWKRWCNCFIATPRNYGFSCSNCHRVRVRWAGRNASGASYITQIWWEIRPHVSMEANQNPWLRYHLSPSLTPHIS